MPKNSKIGTLLVAVLAITLTVLIVSLVSNAFNQKAEVGEVTVKSSGQVITPVTNVLKYNTDGKSGGSSPLKLEEIADTLPEVEYDGDLVVGYSRQTLDSFMFSMYDEELSKVYDGWSKFVEPETPGTYIVRIQFSWGNSEKNSIFTENYFKISFK